MSAQPLKSHLKKIWSRLTEDGKEIGSSIPMAPPVGYKRQPTLVETIREMVRAEHLQRDLDKGDVDTFEDADDFEIPDDEPDPYSKWENDFEPTVKEIKANEQKIKETAAKLKATEDAQAVLGLTPTGAPKPPPTPPSKPAE